MNAHVVVVDDDADSREYATTVLANAGYVVEGFADPLAALAWLQSERPCAVLVCDVVLPHVDGTELAQLVSRDRPGTAIVLCTGDQQALEDAVSRGLLPLPKPYAPEQLLALVEDAVANARRSNA